MNMVRYYAVFSPDPPQPGFPNGAICVDFPDIQEGHTFGATEEEAKEMALDLLIDCIEWRRFKNMEIPPSSLPEKIPLDPGDKLVLIEYDADTCDTSGFFDVSDEIGQWNNKAFCPVCGYWGLSPETPTEFICDDCGAMGLYLDEAVPIIDDAYDKLLDTMLCPVCRDNERGMYPDRYYGYKCSNPACGAKGVFPDRKAAWDAGGTFAQRKAAWDAHRKQQEESRL